MSSMLDRGTEILAAAAAKNSLKIPPQDSLDSLTCPTAYRLGDEEVTDKHASVSWSTANSLARNVKEAVEFAIHSAEKFISWLPGKAPHLRNRTVLEIGPGQDLGFPLILMGFGAKMVLIDRYLCQWDPDFHPVYYRTLRGEIRKQFHTIETAALDQVIENNAHAVTNLRTIKVGLENIDEVPDSSVDVSYSNATFEHLANPAKAIQQLARVTR